MSRPEAFVLQGDHITLDALLKACGAVASGGEAKRLIGEQAVKVNCTVEVRRGRKLRSGDVVTLNGRCLQVAATADPGPTEP